MNIIFLTTRADHHYYLINAVNEKHRVKKVFFQVDEPEKRSFTDKLKVLTSLKKIRLRIRWRLLSLLFNREEQLQSCYEKEKGFNNRDPFLSSDIQCDEVSSFNDPEVVQKVKAEEPDLIIVFGTKILKGEILGIAKMDIINIHRSILPDYRGGSANIWAILNKDFDHLGVTIHKCAEDLDGGSIIAKEKYSLQKDDKVYTIRLKTTELAKKVLLKVIDQYENGTVEYRKQTGGKVWFSSHLTIDKHLEARKNLENYIKSLG